MTTTNILANRIETDLKLYFEMTISENTSFQDWNDWILEMVKERLFSYSEQVMSTELGDTSCSVHSSLENITLKDAFVYFGASITEDGEHQPVEWNKELKMWSAMEGIINNKCEKCGQDYYYSSDNMLENLKWNCEDCIYDGVSEDEDDVCESHPPYKCDGGCGKIVGDGHDDECTRICEDCMPTCAYCSNTPAKKALDSDCYGCSGECGSCTNAHYWNLCDECFKKESGDGLGDEITNVC